MNVAIIPARGGSKRIPRKNIKRFCGKPMLAWAIENAINSECFDKVIVTSDDNEILNVAQSHGADIPFIRPKKLSDDITPTVPVIAHAVEKCIEIGWNIKRVCCIYPCSPFVQPDDIRKTYNLMNDVKSNYVYPVGEYPHPIQRAMKRNNDGKMIFIVPENELKRTQDFEITYHDLGQFYWGERQAWLDHKKMHTDGVGMIFSILEIR